MKKNIYILLLLLSPVALFAQRAYWQQETDYKIRVSLNDSTHELDGQLSLRYVNHSPDTLDYIWFHIWPNAYKNDRTAFSNQMIALGNRSFYFSQPEQKGYINRLNFSVNGFNAATEDHPRHIDIIKLLLPFPLLPGNTIEIETPFHVKIPDFFSRLGHEGQLYHITQWYPKPAVYDAEGWHPMPYLEQGEFYSEFGNFEVNITLPEGYTVAATGKLVDHTAIPDDRQQLISSSGTWKFHAEKTPDFAWFAGKNRITTKDTLLLPSGKEVSISVHFPPEEEDKWKNGLAYAKQALRFYSGYLGDYPYREFSVVAASARKFTAMEYPGITLISTQPEEDMLKRVIAHEAGHNWFQAALGSNERKFPWMDEGLNTWMEEKFMNEGGPGMYDALLNSQIKKKRDQPIATASEAFSELNYALIAYYKTARWMRYMENELGEKTVQEAMRKYYEKWAFKHPSPEDFRRVLEENSGKNLETLFALLYKKGHIPSQPAKKKIVLSPFYQLKETTAPKHIQVLPIAGGNAYDGIMPAIALHNYQFPLAAFRYHIAPAYATRSQQWNGTAQAAYHRYGDGALKEWSAGMRYTTFSTADFGERADRLHFRMQQWMPELKFMFGSSDEKSTRQQYIRLRHYRFREESLLFRQQITGQDTSFVPGTQTANRYLNQALFGYADNRALYPYKAELLAEQFSDLIRLGFTGNYFFNFATTKKTGVSARLFAGKIFYTASSADLTTRFRNSRYHLNMTGPKGSEDYTYSDYFVGRNDFEGFRSQQIMIRDGAFKVRTDLLSSKIGKTDNWLAALNLVTDVPENYNPLRVLPFKIPLKIFMDIGTYADAWETDETETNARFLYDAGLQFSILKNGINIYVPLLYSKVYRDYFNSTLGENRFWKTISFSINLEVLHPENMLKWKGNE